MSDNRHQRDDENASGKTAQHAFYSNFAQLTEASLAI